MIVPGLLMGGLFALTAQPHLHTTCGRSRERGLSYRGLLLEVTGGNQHNYNAPTEMSLTDEAQMLSRHQVGEHQSKSYYLGLVIGSLPGRCFYWNHAPPEWIDRAGLDLQ